MSGQRGGPIEEDTNQNPFLHALRTIYEGTYSRAVEKGDATTLLVPCAESLEGESFSRIFVEAHVLQATRMPGCFMNLQGQGVEVKDSGVSTHLGFSEERSCEILQSESMYDHGNTFRVLVISRPLVGKYRATVDRSSSMASAAAAGLPCTRQESPGDWLNMAPSIQDDFFDQVDRFRKTFVQVPGCEQSTAERIREIVMDANRRLKKHHRLTQASQQRQLDYHVSRHAYAALHSFIFPHLTTILSEPEARLEKAISSYASVADLVEAIPGAHGRGLGLVDVSGCSEQLALMDHKITPHEKIGCIDEAHGLLQRCVAEGSRAQEAGGSVVEITGDDVLSLFILAVYSSSLRQRLAHVAHVEMYLQGAAGRSGSNEAARFEEAGYAVSALQAALQFFLEERRQASGVRGAPRSTTDVFSRHLQPNSGTGAAAPDTGGELDKAGMQLTGLVRQAQRRSFGQ